MHACILCMYLVKIHRKTKSKVALKFVDRKGLSKEDEKLVMMEVSKSGLINNLRHSETCIFKHSENSNMQHSRILDGYSQEGREVGGDEK